MITSFRHDKARRDKKRALLVFLAVSTAVLLLFWGPITKSLGGVVSWVAEPIWGASSSVRANIETIFVYLRSKETLQKENLELRESLHRLAQRSYAYALIEKEYNIMKKDFGREESELNFAMATVLARPTITPYDTMIIDLGESDGILPGMKVYMNDTFVIGEVVKLSARSSLVSMYTTSGYELPVYVGSSSVPAIAKGGGGGNFRISVPRGTEASVGDGVSIPAIAPTFIGIVEAVDAPENTSFSTLFVALPTNYLSLRHVYVAIEQPEE